MTQTDRLCHTTCVGIPIFDNLKKFQCIADCEICTRIPQQFSHDIDTDYPHLMPPEGDALQRLVELNDESTHRYCTSITTLLKCPDCGTYYYHNHYDDDGEFFMDPPSDSITLRRYDVITAREFMERIVADPEGALPNALGRLIKAFLDGTGSPTTRISDAGLVDKQQVVQRELLELQGRYVPLMEEMTLAIQQRTLNWHLKEYIIKSLCNHYYSQQDWDTPSRLLLRHPDPEVRMLTAKLVMGIGTGDAPVMDLIHACYASRIFLEEQLKKKRRIKELTDLLLELTLTAKGETLEYDHGYGQSRYIPRSIRSLALYYLVVAAGQRADLLPAIPTLVGLLIPISRQKSGAKQSEAEEQEIKNKLWAEKRANYEVCRVLRELAEKKKRAPRVILDEIDKIESKRRVKIIKDENVKQLLKLCDKKLGKEELVKMPIGYFLDKNSPPQEEDVKATLGTKFPLWQALLQFMEDTYQLTTEFSYGGKNYGWNLWYRKSGKTLVSLYPQSGSFVAQVVLGREQVEKALSLKLGEKVGRMLQETPQLHDGKWLFIPVENETDLEDVKQLLLVKRKPLRR